jgi:MFS family permease
MASMSSSGRLLSREFLILAGATMLFFGAMGSSNPVLPRFVTDELGASDTMVGVVLGSMAVPSLLARPLLGRLGDERGARLLMIVGCVLGALGMVSLVVVNSIGTALLSRVPFGFAQAAVMTGATALAMDLAPPERRGEAASYILVAFHFGLGLGPLLGEFVLGRSSFDGVWSVLAVLMAVGALVALFLPNRQIGREKPHPSGLLNPAGLLPGVLIALGMMGAISLSVFLVLYADELGVEHVAPLFFAQSLTVALVRIVFGRLPDRVGPVRAFTIAVVLAGTGSALLAAWAEPAGLYVGSVVIAAGGALMMPALVPVSVHGVDEHRRASALATFTMFIDISVALTGPVFGLIASRSGYRAVFIGGAITSATTLLIVRSWLVPTVPRWPVVHPVTVSE